jgi:hypothetical protein
VTYSITFRCDGRRKGEVCGSFFHSRWQSLDLAWSEARRQGWRETPGFVIFCGFLQHDETLQET